VPKIGLGLKQKKSCCGGYCKTVDFLFQVMAQKRQLEVNKQELLACEESWIRKVD
jgi:hypothetical protein